MSAVVRTALVVNTIHIYYCVRDEGTSTASDIPRTRELDRDTTAISLTGSWPPGRCYLPLPQSSYWISRSHLKRQGRLVCDRPQPLRDA